MSHCNKTTHLKSSQALFFGLKGSFKYPEDSRGHVSGASLIWQTSPAEPEKWRQRAKMRKIHGYTGPSPGPVGSYWNI